MSRGRFFPTLSFDHTFLFNSLVTFQKFPVFPVAKFSEFRFRQKLEIFDQIDSMDFHSTPQKNFKIPKSPKKFQSFKNQTKKQKNAKKVSVICPFNESYPLLLFSNRQDILMRIQSDMKISKRVRNFPRALYFRLVFPVTIESINPHFDLSASHVISSREFFWRSF